MKRLLLIALLSASCMTPYQAMGYFGGYEDEYLGDDTYMIIIKVNAYTSAPTAYKYFHQRAREIVKENGYSRYEVIETESSIKTNMSTNKGGQVSMYQKPRYFGRIKCFRD